MQSEQNGSAIDSAREKVADKRTDTVVAEGSPGNSYLDWRERPAETDDADDKSCGASESDGTDSEFEVEGLVVEDEDAEEPVYKGKMKLAVKDKFHSYVRPVWQPKLSTFCTGLTGISQVCC